MSRATDKYYGEAARNYNLQRQGVQWQKEEDAFDALLKVASSFESPENFLSVLDLPAGTGRWLAHLFSMSAPIRYLGVDISNEMLAIAAHEAEGLGLTSDEVAFQEAGWRDFLINNEFDGFDLIICTRFLGHWRRMEMQQILSGLSSLTKGYGIIQVRCPHSIIHAYAERISALRNPRSFISKLREGDTLTRSHMRRHFETVLYEAGLEVKATVPIVRSKFSTYEYWLVGR